MSSLNYMSKQFPPRNFAVMEQQYLKLSFEEAEDRRWDDPSDSTSINT